MAKKVLPYRCPQCGKIHDYPVYHLGKSTTPDQLDQTWMNCLNLFDVEYNA